MECVTWNQVVICTAALLFIGLIFYVGMAIGASDRTD